MPRRSLPTFALICSNVVAMVPGVCLLLFLMLSVYICVYFPDTRSLASGTAARGSGRGRDVIGDVTLERRRAGGRSHHYTARELNRS